MHVTQYSREEVLRMFDVSPRQLRGWEKSNLIPEIESYGFRELSRLRVLCGMNSAKVSNAAIQKSTVAMQRVSGMSDPLLEATPIRAGKGMVFRHSGCVEEPILGQFLFDFGMPKERENSVLWGAGAAARDAAIAKMFVDAVALEGKPEGAPEAMAAYRRILELHPGHAASSINLGTLHYNQRNFAEAERLYRAATETDPNYALAFFDLGNVLDELRRLPEAVTAYQRAIQLVPSYADAHYNLALTFERMGQPRRALRHWNAYLRLDASGAWASHARSQVARIMQGESLCVVFRRGCPVERTA